MDPRSVEANEVVVDVRSPEEFAGGHFAKSINVPLNTIDSLAQTHKKNEKIVVCCASGGRSERAKQRLLQLGFESVENAGAWTNLK